MFDYCDFCSKTFDRDEEPSYRDKVTKELYCEDCHNNIYGEE